MKRKMKGVLGVGLAFVLVVSLMAFAIPVLADPDEVIEPEPNEWTAYEPTPGSLGDWFIQGAALDDELIGNIGPIAQSPIDGDLYAYVGGTDSPMDLFKSEDGGRTWFVSTATKKYAGGPIIDMVCSSMDEDVLYVTDGNYVYKSVDGGDTFALLAAASLETALDGNCGCTITWCPITSIDVGYDMNDKPLVFIGTKATANAPPTCSHTGPASVLYIAEAVYPVEWTDLDLHCYSCGGFAPYAVATTPEFADTGEVMVLVTSPLQSITFTLNTAAVVEITAGPNGATFSYSALPGDISYSGGVSPDTLSPGEVQTFAADTSQPGGTVTINVTAGTLSWRVKTGSASFCGGTHVISTKGTICNWTEQAEIMWDCCNSFEIGDASRIGFPEDWADTETLFVGVVAGHDEWPDGCHPTTRTIWPGDGGDVYMVTSPSAIDLNVAGSATGCIGIYHADIISLDVVGNADDGSLIAGAYDASADIHINMVYYSTDGGWEWDHCDKCPSGDWLTYVLWVGDSALAATTGCECAVSLSCGEEIGEYWNQISLIATDITWIGDIDHSPAYYSGASETFFMVTECFDCCGAGTTWSAFRYDGTYWERVYVSTIFSDTLIDWVQVSPDADTTEAVFLANQNFDIFRSLDYGCSWTLMRYPCAPKPSITAWVVIDEETVVCGGGGADAGTVFKTTNHGARPWKEYTWDAVAPGNAICFALEPGYSDPGSILLGDNLGQVFISFEEGGEEWDEIVDSLFAFSSVETYVIFDPGYGTSGDEGENMVYAAAGDTIGRCDIDPDAKWSKQDWKAIYDDLAAASGIDAAGDTALYVADRGSAAGTAGVFKASGTIAVRYTCASTTTLCTCDLTIDNSDDNVLHVISGTFEVGEPVSIIEYNLYCEAAYSIYGEILVEGLLNGGLGRIDIIEEEGTYCGDCTVDEGAVEVLSSYLTVTTAPAPAALGIPSGVVRSLNPMADVTPTMKVVFEDLLLGLTTYSPELWHHADSDDLWLTTRSNVLWTLDWNNRTYIWVWDDPLATPVIQESPSDGTQLTSTSKVTLEWAELDDADKYEINLYRYCAECPDEKLEIDVDNSTDTCAIVSGLDAGTLYYWEVRVALGEPFLSKWSGLWEFTTALGEVPSLCSPYCGAEDVILTTNFSWDAVSGASSYEIEIATNEDFDPVIASGTATVNAWVASPKLDYSTTYYWRVRAVSAGVPGAWSVCIFTTEAPPVVPPEPVPPVEIPPLPAPITPLWIWVIIGIGAALTIAVIVLIVTTRRVP